MLPKPKGRLSQVRRRQDRFGESMMIGTTMRRITTTARLSAGGFARIVPGPAIFAR